MTNTSTKSLIFARVSSKEQEDTGYSLDSQVKLLQDYASSKQFEVIKVWRISESASGKQIRKTFNEMLRYASLHNIPVILCEKIDRLTRNMKDASIIDEWVKEKPNRSVHFVKEAFTLHCDTKAHENFIWDTKVAVARFYANNLSEEVKKGQQEKLAQGWMPMRAKLGYKTIGEKGHKTHVPDKYKAPFMQKAFELYASGNYSLKALVEVMHKHGLRNEYGGRVVKSRMHQLLSDPFYCGKIIWKGKVYQGSHEPLISKELFDTVQQKLGRKTKNPVYSKHFPVFKGKIECEECGGIVCWYTAKGHWYGACNHYKNCSQRKCTRQEKVEEQVFDSFQEVAPKSARVLQWLEDALKESHVDEMRYNTNRREELAAIVRRADTRLEKAYRGKLDGDVPAEVCEKIIAETTQEKEEAIEALARLNKSRQAYYEAGYAIHELAQRAALIYQSSRATTEDKRLLLSYAFSNLTMNQGKIRKTYTLAFQFLKEWMPLVNKNLEPPKPLEIQGEVVGNVPESAALLALLNQFRTFDWAEEYKYPTVILSQMKELLAEPQQG